MNSPGIAAGATQTGPWPNGLIKRLGAGIPARSSRGGTPIIALSGAPGSGKSALARQWAVRTGDVAVISLDDFYLSPEARSRLAAEIHPWLARRGVPGTHDPDRLRSVLDRIESGQAAAWPRFDKGRDRPSAETRTWPGGQPRLILVEGWCLGARPLGRDTRAPRPWLEHVNRQLARYRASLFERFDRLVFLRAPDLATVAAWRQESERRRPSGAHRFTPDRVRALLEPMAPIIQSMLVNPPCPAEVIELDHYRRVRSCRK